MIAMSSNYRLGERSGGWSIPLLCRIRCVSLILMLSVFAPDRLSAQNSLRDIYFVSFGLSGGERFLFMRPSGIQSREIADTAQLTVTYKADFIREDETPCWVHIRAQHGERMQVQTDMRLYYFMLQREGFMLEYPPLEEFDDLQQRLRQAGDKMGGKFFNEYIVRDSVATVISGDYFEYNQPWVYTESYEPQAWRLLDQVDSVCAYPCHTAEAEFRGRTWRVWYTLDIPLRSGPWKLNGLPGLILKAEDSEGKYRFQAIDIHQRREPIYENRYGGARPTTYKKYKRLERTCFEHPYEYLVTQYGGAKNVHIYYKDPVNGRTELNETNWHIPYDPLERE